MRTIRKKIMPTFCQKDSIDSKLYSRLISEEEAKSFECEDDLSIFFDEEGRYVTITAISPTKHRNAKVYAILRDSDGKEIMRDSSEHWQDKWSFVDGEVEYCVEIVNPRNMVDWNSIVSNTEDKYRSLKMRDFKEILLRSIGNGNKIDVKVEMIYEESKDLKLRAVFESNERFFSTAEEDKILTILNVYLGTNFTSFFMRSDMPESIFFVDSPKIQCYLLTLKSHEDYPEKEIVIRADHKPTPKEAWSYFVVEILDKLPGYHYVSSVKRITQSEYLQKMTGEKWEENVLGEEELPF